MSKKQSVPPRRIFVPSSQAVEVGDGHRQIGPNAMRRGDAAARYYDENKQVLGKKALTVLVSGGYAKTAKNQAAPKYQNELEAHLLRDYLIGLDVPAANIEVEDSSTSAISNVARTIQSGWISRLELNEYDQMVTAASDLFSQRLNISWHRAGFDTDYIHPLGSMEEMDLAFERKARALTRVCLRLAQPVGIASPDDMLHAESMIDSFVAGRSANNA